MAPNEPRETFKDIVVGGLARVIHGRALEGFLGGPLAPRAWMSLNAPACAPRYRRYIRSPHRLVVKRRVEAATTQAQLPVGACHRMRMPEDKSRV